MNTPTGEVAHPLDKLTRQQLRALVVEQAERLSQLEQLVLEQAETIRALQEQLAKNSSNSDKPPSSDGLKKPHPKSLRQKSGRKPGGQKGHKGRRLEMSATPDHVVRHRLNQCPKCAQDLSQVEPVNMRKRQVYDVPPVAMEVTEHQVECKTCPHCEEQVEADYPVGVTQETQYGERIKAQASYLNVYQLLPMARTSELLGDFYNHAPAPALVIEANRAVQKGTEPAIDAIRAQLIEADVTHHDESGLRIAGKNQWLHLSSTDTLTHYGVHEKRGREAMAEIGILTDRQGVVVHDFWKSYQSFDQCSHAYCNAHLLRELVFIYEQYEQAWAMEMIQLLVAIKSEVDASLDTANSLPAERLRFFADRYDQLVKQGLEMNPTPDKPPNRRGRVKQSKPKNLLDRLQAHQPEILAFMHDFRIPFDNNLAERDVRMIKLKQKISGAFRTQDGADTFCHIRSYISTVRKQGVTVIDAISNALLHQPFIPATSNELAE
jgi:hypothetical protein